MADEKAKQLTQFHEGLRLRLYKCTAGKWSIGYGRNIEDRGIRLDEAKLMFENDIKEAEQELRPFQWFERLNDVRKGVLIELNFAMGLTKLLKFEKMILALDKEDYQKASIELLDSEWSRKVGMDRSNNLANRMLRGKYSI